MNVVGLIEFHMKARGHPTATAKGKRKGGERHNPMCYRRINHALLWGLLLLYNVKQNHKLSKTINKLLSGTQFNPLK